MSTKESDFQNAVSFWTEAWKAYDERVTTGGDFSLEIDSKGAVMMHSEHRGAAPQVERISTGDIPLGSPEVIGAAARLSATQESMYMPEPGQEYGPARMSVGVELLGTLYLPHEMPIPPAKSQ